MSTQLLIIVAFAASTAVTLAMLVTSGLARDLFSRFWLSSALAESQDPLAVAADEWIENHEFWELGEVEEVAF